MEYEVSCGIIPVRRVEGRIEYLLLHSALVRNPDAAWEFPKGSPDDGENETQAALRELQEETGITAIELLPDFRDQVQYQYRREGRQIQKTVTFFTGEVSDWSPIPEHPPTREHGMNRKLGNWFTWVDQDAAYRLLFHPGMRNLLERTAFFIYEHDRIQRSKRPR